MIDESYIMLFAARYALGRQSASVAIVTDYIRDHLDAMLEGHRRRLADEITDAVVAGRAGGVNDVMRWDGLKRELEQR